MNRTEHLLTILMEECNEVAQRASKAKRFGVDEIQDGQSLTNAERIVVEWNDLFAVMDMLLKEGVVKNIFDFNMANAKQQKVEKYLEYSRQMGTLTDG